MVCVDCSHFHVGVSEVMAAGLQGKVGVAVRGQRLNQTKEEKAGVIYGVDHRLHWTVSAPMPKIVVSACTYCSYMYSISSLH